MRSPMRPLGYYRRRSHPGLHRGTYGIFDEMNREMNDMLMRFRAMMDDDGDSKSLAAYRNSPAVDFDKDDQAYHLSIELPGISAEELQVHQSGDTLRISGEKQAKREESEDGSIMRERSYGSFSRTLKLPEDVDPDGIKANFSDGVLEIEIPRNQMASEPSRQIEVRSEQSPGRQPLEDGSTRGRSRKTDDPKVKTAAKSAKSSSGKTKSSGKSGSKAPSGAKKKSSTKKS